MDKIWLRIGVSALALITAQQAYAQNFYAGLGFENSNMDWNSEGLSDTDYNATSVLLGYRYDLPNSFFVGGELETTLSIDYSYEGISGESMDRLSRLRLLAGYNFGQFAVFGALGGAKATGDLLGVSTNDDMSGLSMGLGGEFAATDRITLRLEAMQDRLSGDSAGANYDWDNTSIRAAAIIKF